MKKPRPKNSPTIIKGEVRSRNGRLIPQCGTFRGYCRHIANKEYADDACKKAYAIERARQRGSVTKGTPNPLIRCGTHKGFKKHNRNGTEPCEECIVAFLEVHLPRMEDREAIRHNASLLEKQIRDGAYLIRPREFYPLDARLQKALRPPISPKLIRIIKTGGDVKTYLRKGER